MRSFIAAVILLAGIHALAPANTQTRQGERDPDPIVSGRAMIRLNNATLESFLTVLNQEHPKINAVAIDSIASRNMHLIQFDPPADPELELLEEDLNEEYVAAGYLHWGELTYEGQTPEGKTGSTWVDHTGPNEMYSSQYASNVLGLPAAQQRSTGNGILVAVLDTGIHPQHPVLQSRIAPGGYNFIANSTSTADVGDNADNDGDGFVDEMTGHGTFVAGLVVLVAPEARLLPVTVLNSDGIGDGWTLLEGIYYAIDRGVEVINLSLGTTYESDAIEEAMTEARSLGIAVAAAAGNFNTNTAPEFPAMLKVERDIVQVFGVTAVDDLDVKAAFSNYSDVPGGYEVFISAPGASVSSAGTPDPKRSIISALPNGHFGVWEGTSMCTPLVAGTLALIRSQHPEWPSNADTWEEIEAILRTTAVDHYPVNPGYANPPQLGVGRLNTAGAAALGPLAPRPGDLNNDGVVGVSDLLRVITDWHQVHTSADINNDGRVSVNDLLIVINNWG